MLMHKDNFVYSLNHSMGKCVPANGNLTNHRIQECVFIVKTYYSMGAANGKRTVRSWKNSL